MQIVQMDNFIKDMTKFENNLRKEDHKKIRNLILMIGPLVLSYIGFTIFNIPFLVILGIVPIISFGAKTLYKTVKNDLNLFNSQPNVNEQKKEKF